MRKLTKAEIQIIIKETRVIVPEIDESMSYDDESPVFPLRAFSNVIVSDYSRDTLLSTPMHYYNRCVYKLKIAMTNDHKSFSIHISFRKTALFYTRINMPDYARIILLNDPTHYHGLL